MEFLDSASVSEARKGIRQGQSLMLILENLLVRHAGRAVKFYDEGMVELASAALPPTETLLCWVEDDLVKVKYRLPASDEGEEEPEGVFAGYAPAAGAGFGLVTYSLTTGLVSQREPAGY